jgi:predicted phage terminase large subunit-like protein
MSENDQENRDFGHNGQNSEGSTAKNELAELIDSVNRLQNERVKEAKELLLPFTLFTKPDYRPNWHHAELAARLDRVARGECRRLMVFMPPQHGKSELVSRRFPAFLLGGNPRLRLMHATHTNDLAIHLNRDVQRIMAGREYRELFPETMLHGGPGSAAPAEAAIPARRTNDYFEIPGHGGYLMSAGVGNSIAGSAADGAIIDDPFGKREDADSPVIRERIWQWYANDLYPRLSAKGWIVLTHTRWHRDDLAGRLLRKMVDRGAEEWDILCLPAIREEGPGAKCDPRQPGEALWPEFKSAADLEIIRRQDLHAYAALYQQDPVLGSMCEWPAELFGDSIWTAPEHWPRKFKLKIICVDPSRGRSDKQGDYSAIVFMGVAKDDLLYVDAIIERIPLDQLVRKTVLFCDQHDPDIIGIEAEQFQELLIPEFRRQCGDGLRWPSHAMKTDGVPKVARIRRLSQFVINREFRFKADSPGCRLLVDQLMDFPLADHDDGPDALEMCLRLPKQLCPERVTYYSVPMSWFLPWGR